MAFIERWSLNTGQYYTDTFGTSQSGLLIDMVSEYMQAVINTGITLYNII